MDLAEVARMRVAYRVPGMDAVIVRRDVVYREIAGEPPARMTLDVYLPAVADRAAAGQAAAPRAPGVLLIHGPVPAHMYDRVKNMGVFLSYGEILAASGMAAVVCNHLHHGWEDLDGSAANLAAAIAWLRAESDALGVDPDRLCLWAFSGGGPQLAPALTASDPRIRCLVGFYPLLDVRQLPAPMPPLPAELAERFSPAACVARAVPWPRPPLLLARAGMDQPWINQPFDAFVQAALAAGIEMEVLNHVAGQHGFDVLDDVPRTHEIIARTIAFIQTHTGTAAAARLPNAPGQQPALSETAR